MNIKLQQNSALPNKKQIDAINNWLMIFAHPMKQGPFPYQAQLLNRRKQLDLKKADTSPVVIDLPNQDRT